MVPAAKPLGNATENGNQMKGSGSVAAGSSVQVAAHKQDYVVYHAERLMRQVGCPNVQPHSLIFMFSFSKRSARAGC